MEAGLGAGGPGIWTQERETGADEPFIKGRGLSGARREGQNTSVGLCLNPSSGLDSEPQGQSPSSVPGLKPAAVWPQTSHFISGRLLFLQVGQILPDNDF